MKAVSLLAISLLVVTTTPASADPKPTITHSPVYDGECLKSITFIVGLYNREHAENVRLKALEVARGNIK